jgi:WD40 repeat protein
VNLHGPVRAATSAGAGDATVTVRFDAWKEGQVAPTKHTVRIEEPKVKLAWEPVAPELRKTLVHPDRKATMGVLQFSPDGAKVFVAAYPSGVVQVFDAATGKELRRVAGPRGFRSSASYAVPSADWKTAYIAVETRKGERVTKDGKSVVVPNYTGEIRVFDLTTGEEKPPLKRPDNGAIATIGWTADGKRLRTQETVAKLSDTGERTFTSAVFDWDPATGTAEKVREGYVYEWRTKDGRWTATANVDYQAPTARLAVKDSMTGKESVLLEGKKMTLGAVDLAADGRFLAATVYRFEKGRTMELKVWDLGTLKEVSPPELKGDQVTNLDFSPDSKLLAVSTFPDGTRLIDTATWAERPLPGKDPKDSFQRFAFSKDGKRLALVGTRYPSGWERNRDPDPLDFPQPRIYLYDLSKADGPRVLVCPQGFVTKLEFDPTERWLAAGATGGVWMFEVGK